jgi:hypothetical protein
LSKNGESCYTRDKEKKLARWHLLKYLMPDVKNAIRERSCVVRVRPAEMLKAGFGSTPAAPSCTKMVQLKPRILIL